MEPSRPAQRRGEDHGDIARGGGRQQDFPGCLHQHIVFEEGDHRDEIIAFGEYVAHQFEVGAGEADMLGQALLANLAQGVEGAASAEDAVPTGLLCLVDLHQVDRIALQALQAGFETAPYGVAGVVVG